MTLFKTIFTHSLFYKLVVCSVAHIDSFLLIVLI